MTDKQSKSFQELNQRSSRAMLKLGLDLDPSYPASLQLVEWALESLSLPGPVGQHQKELLQQVQVMYGWKHPESYLLNQDAGEGGQELPQNSSPQQLAQELAENLFENLQQVRPELRSSE